MMAIILMIVTALVFPGIILRVRSLASGRKGPRLMQPMKEIAILLGKGSVFGDTTGIVFRIAPAISLSAILCSMLVLPFANQKPVISFDGDFIFFSFLLALGKFFSIIGALDTGSSFQGMGANREALFSMLIEPAFFILLATFAMFTGYTSFSGIFSHFNIVGDYYVLLFSILAVYIFVQIAVIENSRIPVDDPKTHLELTMIHEVMILDNSGFDKALIHIGSYLKFTIFGTLLYNIFATTGMSAFLHVVLFFLVQIVYAVIIGLVESFRARNKMDKNPKFILTISAIAWLAFVLILTMTSRLI
jgi:formate hydrogenlyase subunit 4